MSTPLPVIVEESNYITKKACIAAGLPLKRSVVAPKSPFKQLLSLEESSCGAISVSFRDSTSDLSLYYNSDLEKSYFDQCFYETNKVGEGAFGIVFRAVSRDDNQVYAVKKSKVPFRSNYDKKVKLEEVRKHELIPSHPNCVQLYRAWVENNYLYLQMEFCDITLESFAAENHNIPEVMLWNILIDMLMAVKNLHDNNLIHLDIKLENILMCSTGICKLADFGLVSDANKVNCNTLEGDQKYLAPEVLNGKFTKAADIFSLGIVMLELLLDLVLPQNGILWQRLRNDIFPINCENNSPEGLFNIVKKMMCSNYLIRPTVDELLDLMRQKHNASRRYFDYSILSKFLERSVEKSQNEIGSVPVANSTPVVFQSSKIWQMNISPIESDEEMENIGNPNKRRALDNNNESDMNNVLQNSNGQYNTTPIRTPKFDNKKSRSKSNTVGRQLFH